MGRSGGRSGGGGSSGGSRGHSYFGSGGSRSSSSSASSSSPTAQTRTAPRTSTAPPPAVQSSHPPTAAQSHSTPPSPYQQQQQQYPQQGGGMLSGLAGTVMQGMAFGGGSAIAHRAIDGIAGPRTVIHEHQGNAVDQAAAQTTLAAIDTGNDRLNNQVEQQCNEEVLQFQQCLRENNNKISACDFYFDVLSQCQKTVKDNAQWQ